MVDQLPTHPVEFGNGKNHTAFELGFERPQHESRFAEFAELRAEVRLVKRLRERLGKGNARFHHAPSAMQSQRIPGFSLDAQIQRMQALWARFEASGKTGLQFAVQRGVARFPNPRSDGNGAKINFSPLEKNLSSANFKNPAALLALGVATRIEYHAIPGLRHRACGVEFHMVPPDGFHTADQSPAFFSIPRSDQFLVVHAMHPPAEEPARKSHLEFIPICIGKSLESACQRGVDRLPIHFSHRRDIFR